MYKNIISIFFGKMWENCYVDFILIFRLIFLFEFFNLWWRVIVKGCYIVGFKNFVIYIIDFLWYKCKVLRKFKEVCVDSLLVRIIF